MKFPQNKREGIFLQRVSRFSAFVKIDNQKEYVHIPNSGRLQEVLFPGNKVIVAAIDAPHRKTHYDLILAYCGDTLVSVDARVPNILVYEALQQGKIDQFEGYYDIHREAQYGNSRIDLLLTGRDAPYLIEVKSITLVKDGVGLFPDAPTQRGGRHVRELIAAHKSGYNAAIIFCIQRSDANAFSPHDTIDPYFGTILRQAAQIGVKILAFRCQVTIEEIYISDNLSVKL